MKYMLLTYGNAHAWDLTNEDDGPAWSHEDVKAMVDFMTRENDLLIKSGEFVYAEGLDSPSTAKTVRGTDGQVVATDGPYLETKEVLAGFWVVDCESEERVLEIAARLSRCPGAGGKIMDDPIEVRPVGEAPA